MPERRSRSGPPLDLPTLEARWQDLHQGDTEAWPQDARVQQAWLLFHQGQFEQAVAQGLAAGPGGLNVVNKAQCVIAQHVLTDVTQRTALWQAVSDRAGGQLLILGSPPAALARAHFWRGLALTQRCRSMNVVRALTLGLSPQARTHLELAVALAPRHLDAHLMLAGYHADIIDQVGPLIAQLSYGVNAQAALQLIERATALQGRSIPALLEQARTLRLLQGPSAQAQVRALCEQAARMHPLDIAEQLEIERARAELQA